MKLPGRDTYQILQDVEQDLQIVLGSLRDAFSASPVPFSPLPMKRRLSIEEQESWQRLQEVLPGESIGYADITCLLAYFGIDAIRNIRRLMRSYTLPCRAGSAPLADGCPELERGDGSYVPGHLARIYDRWGDSFVLEWLLGVNLPGRAARAERQQALICLWDDHRDELLRTAAISAAHQARLADALLTTCRMLDEPLVWRAYARHLRQALYSRDRAVRGSALRLLAHLRKHSDIRADEALNRRHPCSGIHLVGR